MQLVMNIKNQRMRERRNFLKSKMHPRVVTSIQVENVVNGILKEGKDFLSSDLNIVII